MEAMNEPSWDSYADQSKPQWQWAMDDLRGMKGTMDWSKLRVLDVGAGDGKITAWIAENLAVESSLVCGIDLAEVQIEHARAAYAASGIQFEVMDAQEVSTILQRIPPATGDMKDNLFDVCVSFTTLHWVYDVPRVFREVATILRPGGSFHARMVWQETKEFYAVLEELTRSEEWVGCFPSPDYEPNWWLSHRWKMEHGVDLKEDPAVAAVSAAKRWAAACGLEVENVYLDERSRGNALQTREEYGKFLSPLIPHLAYIPVERRSVFLGQVLDGIMALPPFERDTIYHLVWNVRKPMV